MEQLIRRLLPKYLLGPAMLWLLATWAWQAYAFAGETTPVVYPCEQNQPPQALFVVHITPYVLVMVAPLVIFLVSLMFLRQIDRLKPFVLLFFLTVVIFLPWPMQIAPYFKALQRSFDTQIVLYFTVGFILEFVLLNSICRKWCTEQQGSIKTPLQILSLAAIIMLFVYPTVAISLDAHARSLGLYMCM